MTTLQILLRPTDVLFFRDGRPIQGSLPGHGAAWPLPSVVNAALHAAMHRAYPTALADLNGGDTSGHGDHIHRVARKGVIHKDLRVRRFGSIVSAGPFPVLVDPKEKSERWYFPRPQDLEGDALKPAHLPARSDDWLRGSLPDPLEYAVANLLPPDKAREEKTKNWLTRESFEAYLRGAEGGLCGVKDGDVFDSEHSIGIAIDPETQTTGHGETEGKIYSAQYLRLRDEWRLGELAAAGKGEQQLLQNLLTSQDGRPVIVVGGQQRVCTAETRTVENVPLPIGLNDGFHEQGKKHLVKWVLLTPAIWPKTEAGGSHRNTQRNGHPGGWLPNWIEPQSGDVLLRTVSTEQRRTRRGLNYAGQGYATDHGGAAPILARLVAAIVPKPIVVTGWSLGEALSEGDTGTSDAGAKSTHLAVPAGAVYYFEADSAEDATRLAAALNWHGSSTAPVAIKNRRSTLMGEKGFGLGVCGTWDFFRSGDAQ